MTSTINRKQIELAMENLWDDFSDLLDENEELTDRIEEFENDINELEEKNAGLCNELASCDGG